VSDPLEPDPAAESHESDLIGIDALPVLAGPPRIIDARHSATALPGDRRPVATIPAVQAAAVAAGGFVAGAAVLGLVHRRQQRATAIGKARRAGRRLGGRKAQGTSRAGEMVQIVGSRSFLLDVHLLGRPAADR
jgi:hypothetical protein